MADDNKEYADLYTEWLKDDYNVRTTYSGEEALEVLDDDIDIAVLDVKMPKVSGYEVFQKIKERGLDCRAIVVTGLNVDIDVTEHGFDYCLTKPVSQDELRDIVDTLVLLDEFSDKSEEYHRLAWKLNVLEEELSEETLERDETYQNIKEREQELRQELKGIHERIQESELYKKVSFPEPPERHRQGLQES